MTALQINRECSKCRFRKIFDCTDNFKILGCMHEPYHGKWVVEIDECPKKKRREEESCPAGCAEGGLTEEAVGSWVTVQDIVVSVDKEIGTFGGSQREKRFDAD